MYGYIGLFVDRSISRTKELKAFFESLSSYANTIKCEACLIEVDQMGNLYLNDSPCFMVKKDRRFQLIERKTLFLTPICYLDLGIVFCNNPVNEYLSGMGFPFAGLNPKQQAILNDHELTRLVAKTNNLELRNEIFISWNDSDIKKAKALKKLGYPVEVLGKKIEDYSEFEEALLELNQDVYVRNYLETQSLKVYFLGNKDNYYLSEVDEEYQEKVKVTIIKIVNALKLNGFFDFVFSIYEQNIYLDRIGTSPLPFVGLEMKLVLKELVNLAKQNSIKESSNGNNN